MRSKMFSPLDKVSIASHRRNENFGEGCTARSGFALDVGGGRPERSGERPLSLRYSFRGVSSHRNHASASAIRTAGPATTDPADRRLALACENLQEFRAIGGPQTRTGIPAPTRLIRAIVSTGNIMQCSAIGNLSAIEQWVEIPDRMP